MSRSRRTAAWFLVGLLVLAGLFSVFEPAREAHHDCSGKGCRVCARIAVAQDLLRTISLAACAVCLSGVLRRFVCRARRSIRFSVRPAPALWKVRLLN
ncbi:MAG: hypothetical protein IJT44_03010 [Clostridia bacterium]|nr:hypothetical protein [Clostridia bacterium]